MKSSYLKKLTYNRRKIVVVPQWRSLCRGQTFSNGRKMKNRNAVDLCPLCGNRKPIINPRADARRRLRVVSKAPTSDSAGPQYSDDKTANDFAEFLLNGRTRRL